MKYKTKRWKLYSVNKKGRKTVSMNDSIPVKVICYSGYKADEYPKYFYWNEIRFEIMEIIDRWYQGDQNPDFPAANYYKVITNDEKTYILKHATKRDKWFLLIHGESINL